MKTIRWGILGTGWIAEQFVKGLNSLEATELYAVASRTQEKADAFGESHDIPVRHGSYEALARDPQVDAVYVATPHPVHKSNTLLCLENGKAVLCEKPFTLNAKEAKTLIDTARDQQVFLMEAMWTRFLPHIKRVKTLIAEGAIGDPRMVQVDFGFRFPRDRSHRLLDPDLGGGALLDAGVYPVSFAHYLFGAPDEIKSFANFGDTGVDEDVVVLMKHAEALSVLSTSLRLELPHEALILGSKGNIRIHRSWFTPSSFSLQQDGKDPETFTPELDVEGYNYEVLEVNRCLREGKLESDIMPLDESLAVMKTLDSLREQWGFRYPSEL